MFSIKMLRLVITAYFVLMTQFAFFQFSVYPSKQSQSVLDRAVYYNHSQSLELSRLVDSSMETSSTSFMSTIVSDGQEIVEFDHNKHWLVFFHIQKTSGMKI